MEKDQIIILENRGLVSITGDEAKEYLQNIITNDVNKVSEDNSILPILIIFFPDKPRSTLINLPLM